MQLKSNDLKENLKNLSPPAHNTVSYSYWEKLIYIYKIYFDKTIIHYIYLIQLWLFFIRNAILRSLFKGPDDAVFRSGKVKLCVTNFAVSISKNKSVGAWRSNNGLYPVAMCSLLVSNKSARGSYFFQIGTRHCGKISKLNN